MSLINFWAGLPSLLPIELPAVCHRSRFIIFYPDHSTHLASAHVQIPLSPGLAFPPRSNAGSNISIQLQILIKFLTSCIDSVEYIHKNASLLAHGLLTYHHYHIV